MVQEGVILKRNLWGGDYLFRFPFPCLPKGGKNEGPFPLRFFCLLFDRMEFTGLLFAPRGERKSTLTPRDEPCLTLRKKRVDDEGREGEEKRRMQDFRSSVEEFLLQLLLFFFFLLF